jgi:hypothetical protein
MIEELDARATLVWENNEVVVYATCILGEETLRPASATTSGGSRRIVRTAWTFTAS